MVDISEDLMNGQDVDFHGLKQLHDFAVSVFARDTFEKNIASIDPDIREAIWLSVGLTKYGNIITKPLPAGTTQHVQHSSDIEQELRAAETTWGWSSSRLQDLTSGNGLSTLLVRLFQINRLFDEMPVELQRFQSFARQIEKRYNDHPYHNKWHACEVLQCVHMIVMQGGVFQRLQHLTSRRNSASVVLAAIYIAAAGHDVGHTGLSNQFLVTTRHALAERFNDSSCNENLHLNIILKYLESSRILENFHKETCTFIRGLIISTVLATDMKQHLQVCADFETCDLGEYDCPDQSVETVLQMAIKCADLGHTAQPWEQHVKSTERLQEEHFRQGDKEKSSGLACSPLMDRARPGIVGAQPKFLETISVPMFEAFTKQFPLCEPLVSCAHDNIHRWSR